MLGPLVAARTAEACPVAEHIVPMEDRVFMGIVGSNILLESFRFWRYVAKVGFTLRLQPTIAMIFWRKNWSQIDDVYCEICLDSMEASIFFGAPFYQNQTKESHKCCKQNHGSFLIVCTKSISTATFTLLKRLPSAYWKCFSTLFRSFEISRDTAISYHMQVNIVKWKYLWLYFHFLMGYVGLKRCFTYSVSGMNQRQGLC